MNYTVNDTGRGFTVCYCSSKDCAVNGCQQTRGLSREANAITVDSLMALNESINKETTPDGLTKVYLAIPYSGMRASSYYQATRALALIMKQESYNVFSPITHSHPVTEYDIPQDWAFWEKIDKQFIDWSNEVWVLIPEEGLSKVQSSTGVQAEIKYAKEQGKPIVYVEYKNEKLICTEQKS